MLKSKKFWSYEISQNSTISDEVFTNYKFKGKIQEDAYYFYEQIGTGIHPGFKSVPGKELNQQTVISFQNILVDINTLKILFLILPKSKVNTLKFSTNNMTLENFEFLITSLLTKPNNIYNFTFEWNDKITIDEIEYSIKDIQTILDERVIGEFNKSQELLESLITTTPYKLEALCLRGNFIGDKTAIKLFEGLKENNILRILNLYKNNLTNECIPEFCKMLLVNKTLEEINFGGNSLTDEALSQIKENYGRFEMTPEELEEYKKLDKERQDIISKNAKAKAAKKPEVDVPYLDEMVEINGVSYRLKNATLKVMNLIKNDFTEGSFDALITILNSNPDLVVTIDWKSYDESQREQLVDPYGKYFNRIYLLK